MNFFGQASIEIIIFIIAIIIVLGVLMQPLLVITEQAESTLTGTSGLPDITTMLLYSIGLMFVLGTVVFIVRVHGGG